MGLALRVLRLTLKSIVSFKEYTIQYEKSGTEERFYVLCWKGDYLKNISAGCQSVDLPVPDAELIHLAQVVHCLSLQQFPLSIVGGSPSLLRVLDITGVTVGSLCVCVQRFNEDVFMLCFRQALQDILGILEVLTAVEYVILRLKSVVYDDWVEDKPCLKKCVRARFVCFGDLHAVLTDHIELWRSIRPYIRYTGHPHLRDVVDRVSLTEYLIGIAVLAIVLSHYCYVRWLIGLCIFVVLVERHRLRIDLV